jgi:hypothetical protein
MQGKRPPQYTVVQYTEANQGKCVRLFVAYYSILYYIILYLIA